MYSTLMTLNDSRRDDHHTLGVSIAKVDGTGLLHVTSTLDWNRWGMTDHNVESSAILFQIFGNSIQLASWIDQNHTTDGEKWTRTRNHPREGVRSLYCRAYGLFGDNIGQRSCNASGKSIPQDGNSWVLLAKVFDGPSEASLVLNVPESLKSR